MRLAASGGKSEPAAAAFAASERARARGLLDLLADAQVDLAQGISSELKTEERRLDQRLSAAESDLGDLLAGDQPPAERVAALRDELAMLGAQRGELLGRIRKEYPRYAGVRYPSPLGLAATQELLAADQALLEYSVGARSSYLFVVTRHHLSTFALPAAGVLREEVDLFRMAVTSRDRRSRGAYQVAARRLYDLLVAPAEAAIGGARELLVSPDGALSYLPFEALLGAIPADGGAGDRPYLLDRWTIDYVPSASVLASLAGGSTRDTIELEKVFVAFADPDYSGEGVDGVPGSREGLGPEGSITRGSERPADLPRLAESAREVRQIAALFGEGRSAVYLQSDATEANVKANPFLPTARWVHFAAHGWIDEKEPYRSGLILTPDPTGSDDGVLRVGEIFNLTLDADLVVLSSCDTGLGKQVSGEGLVGLTRAFLYAGTPSVIVSLWEVEDRSTADLMVAFKRHLDEGSDKAEALRRAKLELMHRDGAEPRQWAPFILVGGSGQGRM